jgi:hypothetical protein
MARTLPTVAQRRFDSCALGRLLRGEEPCGRGCSDETGCNRHLSADDAYIAAFDARVEKYRVAQASAQKREEERRRSGELSWGDLLEELDHAARSDTHGLTDIVAALAAKQ